VENFSQFFGLAQVPLADGPLMQRPAGVKAEFFGPTLQHQVSSWPASSEESQIQNDNKSFTGICL